MSEAALIEFPDFASGPLSPNAPRQLDVLWQDGDAFGMDSTKIGVFQQPHEIGFTGLLLNESEKDNAAALSNCQNSSRNNARNI